MNLNIAEELLVGNISFVPEMRDISSNSSASTPNLMKKPSNSTALKRISILKAVKHSPEREQEVLEEKWKKKLNKVVEDGKETDDTLALMNGLEEPSGDYWENFILPNY